MNFIINCNVQYCKNMNHFKFKYSIIDMLKKQKIHNAVMYNRTHLFYFLVITFKFLGNDYAKEKDINKINSSQNYKLDILYLISYSNMAMQFYATSKDDLRTNVR